jgi:deoxyribodipyrimidine photo-lyase
MLNRQTWQGSREFGNKRLDNFLSHAGRDYQNFRNFDYSTEFNSSSCLSPYISKGLLSESEVIKKVLRVHSLKQSEKFVQEVFWRTYWKGWLEMRPKVWEDYRISVNKLFLDLENDKKLTEKYNKAISSQTGIDCFDFWINELVNTGYLHNHARMWFASIWIFTLDLPWQLGADFFYSNLLDADPASNTLSWRWVAGIQTKGKHYLATNNNIRKFTENHFNPKGLKEDAETKYENITYDIKEIETLPTTININEEEINILIFEENLLSDFSNEIGSKLLLASNICILTNSVIEDIFNLKSSPRKQVFSRECINDLHNRLVELGVKIEKIKICNKSEELTSYLSSKKWIGLKPNVGFYADLLKSDKILKNGFEFHEFRQKLDSLAFPFAKKGFFNFKTEIPNFIEY